MRIKIVLVGGLAASALGISLALLHSPTTVASTNGVAPAVNLGQLREHERVCQTGENVPAHVSALRLALTAVTGPRVKVELLAGGRTIARATRGSAWYGSTVTVALPALARAQRQATLCFELSDLTGIVLAHGAYVSRAVTARTRERALPGTLSVAYMHPGHTSWWGRAGAVIRHMGLGRAASGDWIVVPIVLLMVGAIGLGCALAVRELT